METKEEILRFLKQNSELLKNRFHVTKVGLFGSFARDEQTKESDIDLLIELEKNTKNIYDLKLSLKEFLSKKLGKNIDIAREKYIKPYAKKYILKDVIYVK